MKATTTWILIADGAHARLFANRGPGKGIEQIEVINGDDRPDSELVRDKLGRTHESVGDTRHAITPRVDPHRELKRAFAQHLGKVLSEPVKHKVYAELDKDLVKVPTKALPEHLGAVMPI